MSADTHDVDLVGEEVVENVARAALFAALMGAFAYVSFPNPFSPAPVTLQVLGVFLAGIFLGPVWGGASLVVYLVAGAVGAPVFSGGAAGLGHLVGSNAGYLISWPVAAFVVGAIVHGGLTVGDPRAVGSVRLVGAMVLATALIYAFGIAGLMIVLGMGPVAAFTAGAAAFIPAEAFKIAAAVGIVRSDAFIAE
ncbi:biotin transporter BioY [Halorientalis salina]|uniref:biotin transporter BioY n=1 Tax=Halorientalis salina TaxID=2932266 RepID=UPI0010AC98E8|nr:biotin transporter BioY [Halorientalis salina]